MANIKSAKKRAIQSERRRLRNRSVRTSVRTVVKKARAAIATQEPGVGEMVKGATSKIDVAVRKGVIHKNTASRLKSRMARKVGVN